MSGLALLAFILLGLLPIGPLLLSSLERQYPPNPALGDVAGILVLGGAESTGLSEEWQQPQVSEAADRLFAALALARRFPQAPILFTGGIGALGREGIPGAKLAGEIFVSSGLAPDRLTLEAGSRTTAENATASLALRPRDARDGDWVLVTSAFHMPRSVETFCAAGWSDLVPWPTDYRAVPAPGGIKWGFVDNLFKLDLALKEYVGLMAYRLTGRASPGAVATCLADTP